MIIKFEVNGAWQLFDDVDSLMYRKLGAWGLELDDVRNIIDYTGTINTVHSADVPEPSYPGRVLLTFMNSKQTENSQVIAYSPIYLMNDQGRTIDTI
jgi:hypothetical protein